MSKRALTRFHPPTRLDDDEARCGLKPPHGEGRGPVAVHRNGVAVTIDKQAAIPTFDDTDPNKYWTADNPWNSVKVAGTGTKITVAKTTKGGTEMQLKITRGTK